MMKEFLAIASFGLAGGFARAADFPAAEITNSQIRVRIYLPDAKKGYYRGTRFDWSGVIYSLQYKSHEFYGPWFQKVDDGVHDFVYQGQQIVAGPCSAITGPVDEFAPVGFNEAKSGESFLKIGVGMLRKPDNANYDKYRLYEISAGGQWTVRKGGEFVEFRQELRDRASGYGYYYEKNVRLTKGMPGMTLVHRFRNTGEKPIQTSVYNHNFLVMDNQPPGPDFVITLPFVITSRRPPNKELAEIRGNQIVYLKTLAGRDVVATPIQGFGNTANDHEICIENRKLGVGVKIRGDRPLINESLWAIRSVIAMEPFISVGVGPDQEFSWSTTYEYYSLPTGEQ